MFVCVCAGGSQLCDRLYRLCCGGSAWTRTMTKQTKRAVVAATAPDHVRGSIWSAFSSQHGRMATPQPDDSICMVLWQKRAVVAAAASPEYRAREIDGLEVGSLKT